MSRKTTAPSFSPRTCHTLLMDEQPPALAFRQGTDLPRWQHTLRRKLVTLTGYNRMPAGKNRPALRVRSLWRRPHHSGLGSIEKIIFTAERGAEVPAYVCLPHGNAAPGAWMICLQGHSTGMHHSIAVSREDEVTPTVPEGDRDFAVGCLKQGMAALCIEQRAFGERTENLPGRDNVPGPDIYCQLPAMRSLMLGRTLLAERVFDVDRGIDYLLTRPDVDRQRIGVMGNSGGGLVSILAGALLPRVSFMIASCSFCTYRDSILSILHCTDNYVPGLMTVAESADVLGLFAPKPLVVVAGREDPIFPLPGVRKAFTDLKRIYRAAGMEDRCALAVGPEGHRFYADLAWPRLLKMLAK